MLTLCCVLSSPLFLTVWRTEFLLSVVPQSTQDMFVSTNSMVVVQKMPFQIGFRFNQEHHIGIFFMYIMI